MDASDSATGANARVLDAAFGRATASCARELSTLAAAKQSELSEKADLQPSFRAALKEEIPGCVLEGERKFDLLFAGNPQRTLGGVDVVVEDSMVGTTVLVRALAELKWAGDRETFAWTVFDALKMASAHASLQAACCYVVVGAPVKIWRASTSAGELLTDAQHSAASIVERYDGRSSLFSAEVAWPTVLPGMIETVVVADSPVTVPTRLWKLRCVRVESAGPETLRLLGGNVVS